MPVNIEEFYSHGGNILAAKEYFKNVTKPWIDLSTGIAPWPYDSAKISLDSLQKLPEAKKLKKLEEVAAEYFGLENSENIAAIAGSDISIRLLSLIFQSFKPALVTPIFSGHSKSFIGARHIDFDNIYRTPMDLLAIANPNNPDGRFLKAEEMAQLFSEKNCRMILDEAFMDANPNESLAHIFENAIKEKVAILRSFGKFFGLPGLRLGFIIADDKTIKRVKELRGDWPISSFAIDIATKAYCDMNWQAEQIKRLKNSSSKLKNILEEYGFEIIGKTDFFITIKTPNAKNLFEHLGNCGILIRPFAYPTDWLRFGLPKNNDDFARLVEALETFTESGNDGREGN